MAWWRGRDWSIGRGSIILLLSNNTPRTCQRPGAAYPDAINQCQGQLRPSQLVDRAAAAAKRRERNKETTDTRQVGAACTQRRLVRDATFCRIIYQQRIFQTGWFSSFC